MEEQGDSEWRGGNAATRVGNEGIDALNDETFGSGAIEDDWEATHTLMTGADPHIVNEDHQHGLAPNKTNYTRESFESPLATEQPGPQSVPRSVPVPYETDVDTGEVLHSMAAMKIKELWPSSPKEAATIDSIWSSPNLPTAQQQASKHPQFTPDNTPSNRSNNPFLLHPSPGNTTASAGGVSVPGIVQGKVMTLEDVERELMTSSTSVSVASPPPPGMGMGMGTETGTEAKSETEGSSAPTANTESSSCSSVVGSPAANNVALETAMAMTSSSSSPSSAGAATGTGNVAGAAAAAGMVQVVVPHTGSSPAAPHPHLPPPPMGHHHPPPPGIPPFSYPPRMPVMWLHPNRMPRPPFLHPMGPRPAGAVPVPFVMRPRGVLGAPPPPGMVLRHHHQQHHYPPSSHPHPPSSHPHTHQQQYPHMHGGPPAATTSSNARNFHANIGSGGGWDQSHPQSQFQSQFQRGGAAGGGGFDSGGFGGFGGGRRGPRYTPGGPRVAEHLCELRPDGSGFMTTKEKDWVAKIQLIQLSSDGPEDYYYQKFLQRRHPSTSTHTSSQITPLLHLLQAKAHKSHGTKTNGSTSGGDGKDGGGASGSHGNKEQQQQRHSHAYQPIRFDGALGKITSSSVIAPRKTLEVSISEGGGGGGGGGMGEGGGVGLVTVAGAMGGTRRKKMALMFIEKLFDLLLSVEEEREEEAKRRKEWEPSSAEGDRDGEKETDKEENLSDDKQADGSGKKGKNSKALCDNICSLLDIKSNGEHVLVLTQHRKGKRLLARLLPLLSSGQAEAVLLIVVKNFPTVIRRDASDKLLPEMSPAVREVVARVSLPMATELLSAAVWSCDRGSLETYRMMMEDEFASSLLLALVQRGREAVAMETSQLLCQQWLLATSTLFSNILLPLSHYSPPSPSPSPSKVSPVTLLIKLLSER